MATYQEIFENGYEQANLCDEHKGNLQFSDEDVREVLYAEWTGEGTFEESDRDDSTFALVKLKDGCFGVFEESEDYTGHG